MASIYKELKLLTLKLKNDCINDDNLLNEFNNIWQNSKQTGKEKRCARKFIRENISDINKADAFTLIIKMH